MIRLTLESLHTYKGETVYPMCIVSAFHVVSKTPRNLLSQPLELGRRYR